MDVETTTAPKALRIQSYSKGRKALHQEQGGDAVSWRAMTQAERERWLDTFMEKDRESTVKYSWPWVKKRKPASVSAADYENMFQADVDGDHLLASEREPLHTDWMAARVPADDEVVNAGPRAPAEYGAGNTSSLQKAISRVSTRKAQRRLAVGATAGSRTQAGSNISLQHGIASFCSWAGVWQKRLGPRCGVALIVTGTTADPDYVGKTSVRPEVNRGAARSLLVLPHPDKDRTPVETARARIKAVMREFKIRSLAEPSTAESMVYAGELEEEEEEEDEDEEDGPPVLADTPTVLAIPTRRRGGFARSPPPQMAPLQDSADSADSEAAEPMANDP